MALIKPQSDNSTIRGAPLQLLMLRLHLLLTDSGSAANMTGILFICSTLFFEISHYCLDVRYWCNRLYGE
uniref:Uncharacterized protein n=1 Tax=Utricularia reniformis TaxID=192314 RepID=A0A1Y0B0K9_9LAMI|nr:hypothetical protein AEK19_MT0682 [Utricularia reniformis]ART30930.1 hypothetical protein AEK19_MT0682 [Utricularia reniformis]